MLRIMKNPERISTLNLLSNTGSSQSIFVLAGKIFIGALLFENWEGVHRIACKRCALCELAGNSLCSFYAFILLLIQQLNIK